jgi:hypothetical protein
MKRSNVWSYTVWLGLVFGVYFGVSQEISHDGVPQYPVGTHEQSAASITDAATAFTSYEVGTAVVARLTITEGVATGAQAVAGSAYTLGTNAVARLVIAEPVLATALQPDGVGSNLVMSIDAETETTNRAYQIASLAQAALPTNDVPKIPITYVTPAVVDTNTVTISGAGDTNVNATYTWNGSVYTNESTGKVIFYYGDGWEILSINGSYYKSGSSLSGGWGSDMNPPAPAPTGAYLEITPASTNTYSLVGLVGHKYDVTATGTNTIAYTAPSGYEIMGGRAWNTTTTNALTFTAGASTTATISGVIANEDVVRMFIVLRKED